MDTPSEKLPRSRLIRRRAVFTATREHGRRVTNRWLTLSLLPRADVVSAETGEVAFLTPKRTGDAAHRNQLRRRMREIYRRCPDLAAGDRYLVWIARPAAMELPFTELREAMLGLLRRTGLLT